MGRPAHPAYAKASAGKPAHPRTDLECPVPFLSPTDCHLWNEGRWLRAWEKLGAHPFTENDVEGYHFAVWAPAASRVSVVGQFNQWDGNRHPMSPVGESGIWACFVPGLATGETYKYEIHPQYGPFFLKADPFGFQSERSPGDASITSRHNTYTWHDAKWMERRRAEGTKLDRPMAIYEVHAGSWRRAPDDGLKTRFSSISGFPSS